MHTKKSRRAGLVKYRERMISVLFLLCLPVILISESGCETDQACEDCYKKIGTVTYNLFEHIPDVLGAQK